MVHPDVELGELLGALGQMLKRADLRQSHRISREALSTRDRMQAIMQRLRADQFTPFEALFTPREGRAGVIVTFMAILELARESMIEIVQNAPLSPIHVRARLALEAGAEAAFDADDMTDAAADEPVFETDGVSDSGAPPGRQQR